MRLTIKLKHLLAFGFIISTGVGTAFYSMSSIADINSHRTETLNGPASRLSATQVPSIAQAKQPAARPSAGMSSVQGFALHTSTGGPEIDDQEFRVA